MEYMGTGLLIVGVIITSVTCVFLIYDYKQQSIAVRGSKYRKKHGEFSFGKYNEDRMLIKDKEVFLYQTNGGTKPEFYSKFIKYAGHLKDRGLLIVNIDKNKNEYKDKGIVVMAWKTIQDGYYECHEKYPSLVFHNDKFDEFKNIFEDKYTDVMRRFMRSDIEALDAHKQAAILTISCLEANVIEHKLTDSKQLSVVPQFIAINVGLSYMQNCINDILKERGIRKKIDKYYFPVAVACDTPYPEIMCRLLYHEQNEQDMSYNVLELAEKYFLLEYINLLQRGIEPYLLKEL